MKDIIRMNQLAGIITEGQAKKMMEVLDENNEFLKLLDDLDTDLEAYRDEEITYEDDPDSEEIRITIYPVSQKRKREIQNTINAILEKNTSFMIDEKSIEQYPDVGGNITSFDIVKK